MIHLRGAISLTYFGTSFSSAGNLLITIAIARNSSVDGFSSFALAGAVQVLMVGLARSAWVENQIVSGALGTGVGRRPAFFLLGAVLFSLSLGLVTGNNFMVVGAMGLPAFSLLERSRILTSVGSGELTFVGAQGVQALVALFVGLTIDMSFLSPLEGYLLWQTVVVAVFGISVFLYRGVLRHEVTSGRFHGWYALDFLAGSGLVSLTMLMLPVVASASAVAGLRGVGTLFAPVMLLISSLRPVFLNRSPSVGGMSVEAAIRDSLPWAFFAGVITISLLLLPDSLGVLFLGASWSSARDLIVPIGLEVCLAIFSVRAFAMLRRLDKSRSVLGVRLVVGLCHFVGIMVVSSVIGFASAVWLYPMASAVLALAWLVILHFAARQASL